MFLSCRRFQGNQVYLYDASIKCFEGQHLMFSITGIFVIVFIGIPAPGVLFFMRSSPRIKPLVDVPLSHLRDDRRWWCALSVFRRMLITLFSVFIQDPISRQLIMAVTINFLMLLHFILQPYRNNTDNFVEAALLTFASIFAVVNMVSPGQVPS